MLDDPTDSQLERSTESHSAETAGDSAAEQSPAKDRDHATASDQPAAAGRQTRNEQRSGREHGDQAEQGRVRAVGGGGGGDDTWQGSAGPGRRLLVIALDGAAPELALGAWRSNLRAFDLLSSRGSFGRIQSVLPAVSVPAWASVFTGRDPGQLGIYAAAQRPNHSYAPPVVLDSRAIHVPRLWDIVGRSGRRVGVVGAPLTSPAPAVNGSLIGDLNSAASIVAMPASFAQQVAQWLADEPDAPPAPGSALERSIGEAYARTEERFRLARRMLARNSYDCFVLFDDGLAQIQRLLWHTLDVTHMRYQPEHALAGVISAFYRFVDEQVGDLLELIDDDTVVVLISAGGAQPLDGELALNDWLIAQGELRLHTRPPVPTPLAECDVDWAATRAWACENGLLYLNLGGREPQGTVAPDAAEALLHRLAEQIQALRPPFAFPNDGSTFAVYRPAALYAATQGVAPDLLVAGVQPGWRTTATVGYPQLWRTTRLHSLDAAYESARGMFVLYDPRDLGGGREITGATVYDVLPTLLAYFDIAPPPQARGRALVAASA